MLPAPPIPIGRTAPQNSSMQGTNPLQCQQFDGVQAAALLFSAGLAQAAIGELEDCLDQVAAGDTRPWIMLFELHRTTGRLDAFERLAARYEMPASTRKLLRWAAPFPADLANTVALKGILASADHLAHLYKCARERKILAIDMGEVERIAYSYAGTFAAALRALNAAGKRIILVNVAEVHAVLLETFGAHKHVALMRRGGPYDEAQSLAA